MHYEFPNVDFNAEICNGKVWICSRAGERHELLTGVIVCPPVMEHLHPKSGKHMCYSKSYGSGFGEYETKTDLGDQARGALPGEALRGIG